MASDECCDKPKLEFDLLSGIDVTSTKTAGVLKQIQKEGAKDDNQDKQSSNRKQEP